LHGCKASSTSSAVEAEGDGMSRIVKLGLILASISVAAVVYAVSDWYRFVRYAELDPKRGVYGNNHLEVWIEINKYMPAAMKAWGCRELLTREAAVMGLPYQANRRTAPSGCNPERDNMPFEQAVFVAHLANADNELRRRRASDVQKEQVMGCLRDGLRAGVTPQQVDAAKTGRDMNALMAINDVARKLTMDCLGKAGF
jgi:hypothetical protein